MQACQKLFDDFGGIMCVVFKEIFVDYAGILDIA